MVQAMVPAVVAAVVQALVQAVVAAVVKGLVQAMVLAVVGVVVRAMVPAVVQALVPADIRKRGASGARTSYRQRACLHVCVSVSQKLLTTYYLNWSQRLSQH